MWRAIRYGLSGELIDFDRGEPVPARARIEALIEWVAPVADEIGAAPFLDVPAANAAERQRARRQEGASFEQIYAEQVAGGRAHWLTTTTTPPEEPTGRGAAGRGARAREEPSRAPAEQPAGRRARLRAAAAQPSLDDVVAQIHAIPIGPFLLSTVSTLASIAYGKLGAGSSTRRAARSTRSAR